MSSFPSSTRWLNVEGVLLKICFIVVVIEVELVSKSKRGGDLVGQSEVQRGVADLGIADHDPPTNSSEQLFLQLVVVELVVSVLNAPAQEATC